MNKTKLARLGLLAGGILILIGFMTIDNEHKIIPAALLIAGLSVCAISFQGFQLLNGFSYTTWILAAVTISMFYPEWFQQIGTFKFKSLILPLLQLIMFGVGSTMGLKDFESVIKTPKPVFIGVVCQFTIMPLVGYTIAKTFNFEPEIAAGIILVGSVPSGLASNVMSYIAKANVALSVTLTAIATLMAPLITPILMQQLAGEMVPVSLVAMMIDITKIVILPICAGLIFNKFLGGKFPWLDRAMPRISMVSIAAIITVITAAGRDSLLEVGITLVFACLIHNLFGYLLGYYSCRLLRMDEKSCRTIALEVGLQNGGLASGLALQMGRVATVGLAPAIFGPLMNITGSSLASWWHNRPVKEDQATNN
jgi:BASS family bile acid:Na+ symporter